MALWDYHGETVRKR